MSANVHPIALITDGAGDASQVFALLQNERDYVASFKQFEGRGQTSRSGSDDESSAWRRVHFCCGAT
jgi:hypothetical protein